MGTTTTKKCSVFRVKKGNKMEKMTYQKITIWLMQNNFKLKEKNKVIEIWYNNTLPDVAITIMKKGGLKNE